jgi:hypothetical protein
MAESYAVEKWRWTNADFERMGWHDSPVRAMAYLTETYELAFDIDYLLEWVQPGPGETYFTFWIAPATLVFENVADLRIDLESSGGITILDLARQDEKPTREGFEGPDTDWLWTLDCLEGAIQFRASGFRQTIRRAPICHDAQHLSLAERGGVSFSEQPSGPGTGPLTAIDSAP